MRSKTALLKLCCLFAALIALCPPEQLSAQQSVDQGGNSGVVGAGASDGGGSLGFQADLFSGRFSYAVPIKVAPGRQGAEPKLTLGYNSAEGNGWCGVGWSLDVGYIQRDVRKGVPVAWAQNYSVVGSTTNYLDYQSPRAKYDDSKGFVANIGGAMNTLVLVGDTNANPVVYRQQVDTSFLTYNYYTNNHWEVVDKSGNTFFFGEGSTNQMDNTNTSWTTGAGSSTFRWALDRVIDANGNETFLKYTIDGGMLYLTNISYNANTNSPSLAATHTVDFMLTNRTDTNISFTSGFRVITKKLLSEIDIKVSGANVRKYVLNYTQSASTVRSLLNSVTEYGSDFSTALPPVTFNYQVKPFTFGAATNWGTLQSQGQTDNGWNSIRQTDASSATYVMMADMDGDGLPDRVMRNVALNSYTNFVVEFNNGSGFEPDQSWRNLQSQGQTNNGPDNSPTSANSDGATFVDLIDVNGDGYPDRVMDNLSSLYTNFWVQFNTGLPASTNAFMSSTLWSNVDDFEVAATGPDWFSLRYNQSTDMLDMNGDGLPDRVSKKINSPFDTLKVQLNTGSGFTRAALWTNLTDSQGQISSTWGTVSQKDGNNNQELILMDINGDGLPDRVMRPLPSYATNVVVTTNILHQLVYTTNVTQLPTTNFFVQFNNGWSFEPAEPWGGLEFQGQTNNFDWISPIGTDGAAVRTTLVDINGDGLPDHVMRGLNSPYTNWVVQLNTGSGFAPSVNWGPVNGQGNSDSAWYHISARGSGGNTYVDFFDVNGDGLPDRVMRSSASPYDHFVVQLNKGPFPDLLNVVSNGLGGSVAISYAPSTTLDNRDTNWVSDRWTEGTKSLLSFNVWVVSQIAANDGMGTISTNIYAFKGGYFNSAKREFRGFSQASVTDPLGTTTTTYFHQSGGRDNSALGEYADQGSESKKGMLFRTEIVGNDGKTNKIVLNKVQEILLNTNGWYFPFIAQTIVMDFEGLTTYRATATRFSYDTNTENLMETVDLGEVTNVTVQGQSCTNVANDVVYKWVTYATNLGNILSKPIDIKTTSDSSGSTRLTETVLSYVSHGRLSQAQAWLDTAGAFITTTVNAYDQYGNLTEATDGTGITSTNVYDSTSVQYPIIQITGTFSNQFAFDARSGATIQAIDAKGLVSSNVYDVFFRETASYISTNAYGAPTLWKTKKEYAPGSITSSPGNPSISKNYTHTMQNNGLGLPNGFETYEYQDGIGRSIETREQAENGQFRVHNTFYDLRGKPCFTTMPYFSPGTNYTSLVSTTSLGSLVECDSVGRLFRGTPAVQGVFNSLGLLSSTNATGGDAGSPVGPVTTAYSDGSNPWAMVTTDPDGKVKKTYRDAHDRVTTVIEVTSNANYTTTYSYDISGNVTNVTDAASNVTTFSYDSRGRKLAITDPDMGRWSYAYDNADRITQQTDARSNTIKFFYSDEIGRLSSKQIFNSGGQQVGAVSYVYDTSDDPGYTVFKGQLYKVVDLQGYERKSYDVRGRALKSARFLNPNAMEYVTQLVYDDADRMQQLVYPGGAATVQYTYDTAGHLSQIKSLAGTGTQETFFSAQSFNEQDQLLGYLNGNGTLTTNYYYANSHRTQRVETTKGTNILQDLAYTYDNASDLASVYDGVYTGAASASLTNILYDDLHRVLSVNSTARGVKNYAYNSIGNVLTNQDAGSGLYQYGAKPHAVTSANGLAYAYDACGNMTNRGGMTLIYDEQNQLVQAHGTNTPVTFGYDYSGERLWRNGTNGYSIWIGGIYEINKGKVLCHVMAGGKRITTFEPQCGGPWAKVMGEKNWYVASTHLRAFMDWPFQHGRAQMTLFASTWVGIFAICLAAGFRARSNTKVSYKLRRRGLLYKQAVTFASLAAFLWTTTGKVEAATYSPVFYYYHADNLGSTTVMTDRSGSLVQHYGYGTYGQTTFTDNSSAFPVSNLYTSQVYDNDTGLYYYGCRYYDAQLARFIQPDSLVQSSGNPQTLNRYAYCGNNPLNRIDPSGHLFIIDDIIAIAIAAAIGAAVGAVTAALNHQNILTGMEMGAINGAFSEFGALGSIAGAVVTAAIQHKNLGQAALLAAFSVALSAATQTVTGQVLQNGINSAASVAEYEAIRTVSGGISGVVNAAVTGKSVLSGLESGAESGAISGAEFLANKTIVPYLETKGITLLGAQGWHWLSKIGYDRDADHSFSGYVAQLSCSLPSGYFKDNLENAFTPKILTDAQDLGKMSWHLLENGAGKIAGPAFKQAETVIGRMAGIGSSSSSSFERTSVSQAHAVPAAASSGTGNHGLDSVQNALSVH